MLVNAKVVQNIPIAPLHYQLTLSLKERIKDPHPGQFAMIKVTDGFDPLLMRPLSIYNFVKNPEGDLLEFIYMVRGKGTRLLSEFGKDVNLRLMVPLGKGFSIHVDARCIVLIAGGLGVVPISFLAECYRLRAEKGVKIICYFGVKSATLAIGLDRLRDTCDEIKIFTEDGSLGEKGLVTEGISRDIGVLRDLGAPFYACGPKGMFTTLAEILVPRRISCEVSLEERMACGVGACLGCVVPTKTEGLPSYRTVCKEGPVFSLHEVILVED